MQPVKNKVIFHGFKLGVYPRMLWVCIGATKQQIEKHFEFDCKEPNGSIMSSKNALCIPVIENNSRKIGIIVLFNSKKIMTPAIMAHEAVHVADYTYNEIDAYVQRYDELNEPYAYLVGYIVDCFDQVRKNKFKD